MYLAFLYLCIMYLCIYLFLIYMFICLFVSYIGDWGLGIVDWAQSPIPNPQSPKYLILLVLMQFYLYT